MEVNAFIEEKLENLSRNGLEQMADVSDGAMLRILGEKEAPLDVTLQRGRWKRSIRLADVSTAGPSEAGFYRISTPVKIFVAHKLSTKVNFTGIVAWV